MALRAAPRSLAIISKDGDNFVLMMPCPPDWRDFGVAARPRAGPAAAEPQEGNGTCWHFIRNTLYHVR